MSFKDKNKLRIDWEATKKANTKVYHLNEHRAGHRYRFYWEKVPVSNISVYSFIACRKNKRRLAEILKTQPTIDYFEV